MQGLSTHHEFVVCWSLWSKFHSLLIISQRRNGKVVVQAQPRSKLTLMNWDILIWALKEILYKVVRFFFFVVKNLANRLINMVLLYNVAFHRYMLYLTLPTGWGPCAVFQLGHRISANSVGKTNTTQSLQKAKCNLLADGKGPHHLNQVVVWVIHLYFYCLYTTMFMWISLAYTRFHTFRVCQSNRFIITWILHQIIMYSNLVKLVAS